MAYKDPENTLVLETTKGNVVLELYRISHRAMSRASRNWHAKALMTALSSIA